MPGHCLGVEAKHYRYYGNKTSTHLGQEPASAVTSSTETGSFSFPLAAAFCFAAIVCGDVACASAFARLCSFACRRRPCGSHDGRAGM